MSLNDGAQMGLMLSFLHKSQMDSKTGLSSRRACIQLWRLGRTNYRPKPGIQRIIQDRPVVVQKKKVLTLQLNNENMPEFMSLMRMKPWQRESKGWREKR
jgi:hypothetical protein